MKERAQLWLAIDEYVIACGGNPLNLFDLTREAHHEVREAVESAVDQVAMVLRQADRAEVTFTGGKW